jgi:hypothetical protein
MNGSILSPLSKEDGLLSGSILGDVAGDMIGTAPAPHLMHFPSDIVGGTCPHLRGEEETMVWNAAAEASATERLHLAWSADGDKVWYIAVPSITLASTPSVWCPFAALLPGMPDARPAPVCYLHTTDESAEVMVVSKDGLQIHRGTTSIIKAKTDKMARELGGAEIVQLLPDMLDRLRPAPWTSLSLREARQRRTIVTLTFFAGLLAAAVGSFILVISWLALLAAQSGRADAEAGAEAAAKQLLSSAAQMTVSPLQDQLIKFGQVNDGLIAIGGWMKKYEITKGKAVWTAIVPPSVTRDRVEELGGHTLESTPQGFLVSNSRAAAVPKSGDTKPAGEDNK